MADERERCPKCGALPVEPGAYTYDWACKSSKRISGYVEESTLCLRRQLTQAQERVARETSEIINAVRALPGELQGQGTLADAIRVLVAHNAQLRRVLERVEWVEPPDAHPDLGRWCPTCRAWESDGHEVHCPYYGGQVNGILADAPANPYTALVDAARNLAVTLHLHNEQTVLRHRLGDDADLADDEGYCCEICCEVGDLLYDFGQALGEIGIDDLSKVPDLRDLAKLDPERRAEAIRRLNEGEALEDVLVSIRGQGGGRDDRV